MQVHEDVSACPRRGAAPPATVEKALEKTRELWIDLRIFQKHKADRESSRSFQSVLFISFFPFFFFFQGERDLFFLRKHTVPDALYIFSHLIIRLASRYVLSPRSLGGGRRTLRRAAVPRTFHMSTAGRRDTSSRTVPSPTPPSRINCFHSNPPTYQSLKGHHSEDLKKGTIPGSPAAPGLGSQNRAGPYRRQITERVVSRYLTCLKRV